MQRLLGYIIPRCRARWLFFTEFLPKIATLSNFDITKYPALKMFADAFNAVNKSKIKKAEKKSWSMKINIELHFLHMRFLVRILTPQICLQTRYLFALEPLIKDLDQAVQFGQFCAAYSFLPASASHTERSGAELLFRLISIILNPINSRNIQKRCNCS